MKDRITTMSLRLLKAVTFFEKPYLHVQYTWDIFTSNHLERAFSTGQIVGMVIGSLIFVSMASAIIYAGIKKQKRTQIKDIIKQAYEDDLTVREEKKKLISGASKPRVVVT